MPETDLDLLIRAARVAGDIACRFAPDCTAWDKPQGAGPVTEADLAVNDALRDLLRGARPNYGWLSEEDTDTAARQNAHRVFVLDPIDGTRAFMGGLDTWGHSLAVVEDGAVIAGVVFMPKLDQLYSAAIGQGANCNGRAMHISQTATLPTAHVIAAKPVFDAKHWVDGPPQMRRSHRPSLAYRLCLVAEGAFDAVLTFRNSWEWDIAAGSLILSEAGATVTDRLGAPLTFNAPHPQSRGLVSANPDLHRALMGSIAIRD